MIDDEDMLNPKTTQIKDLQKEIEYLKKEMTILHENYGIEIRDKDRRIVDLMNINDSHKTTNGDLRVLNNQLLKENDKMKEVINKSVSKLRENGEI